LLEIRQKENESVNMCVSRCAETLLELKAKTDILVINSPLQLLAADGAIYIGMRKQPEHVYLKKSNYDLKH
jgi:hypothetical protein